jgi:hypothetical protein
MDRSGKEIARCARNGGRGKVSLDAALLGITAVQRFLMDHDKCVLSRRLIWKIATAVQQASRWPE